MSTEKPSAEAQKTDKNAKKTSKPLPEKEFGGYETQGLLEPTRFGDWEVKGRCSDF